MRQPGDKDSTNRAYLQVLDVDGGALEDVGKEHFPSVVLGRPLVSDKLDVSRMSSKYSSSSEAHLGVHEVLHKVSYPD